MKRAITAYKHLVVDKYQQYNALFLRLPFYGVPEAGGDLPKFTEFCQQKLAENLPPNAIVEQFFKDEPPEKKFITLFLFLQFVERQIVLFDALEDCSFGLTHESQKGGSIEHLPNNTTIGDYKTRIVLTAHPTQFYTPYVLNIIKDLSDAIKKEDMASVEKLLLQMGKTPFLSKTQPTPLDEANFLIRYLTTVFYPTIQNINYELFNKTGKFSNAIQLGFWPGGDRDGNPNVTAQITLQVADNLKQSLLLCYQNDITKLERRLTFATSLDIINKMKNSLHQYQNADEFLYDINTLRNNVINEHGGLFVELVDHFIAGVHSFGLHFASLDLRQDSRIHSEFIAQYIDGYANADNKQKIKLIETALLRIVPEIDLTNDCITSCATIPTVQHHNGLLGMHRYVISNTQSSANLLEVLLLNYWAGNDINSLYLDIVPLFETIDDLKHAQGIMAELYQNTIYQQHLHARGNKQTIMLGFSDGTKDGGYITANWSIYQAKKSLSQQAKEYGVDVIFFDGRGGPPSRGGGKTQQYYRGHEKDIAQTQIQLTIQGQTISTNFGTLASAEYNIGELFCAGLNVEQKTFQFTDSQFELLTKLSSISAKTYQKLKDHPAFFDYLAHGTPMNYFGELNIASRPPKRGRSDKLTLDDLRAIPFVSAWTLMKQNVPGYFGVGSALQTLIDQGHQQALQDLYQQSLYFKTLLDNAMQSLKKADFRITQYLADHPNFGDLWNLLQTEAQLSRDTLLTITGCQTLLENDPITKLSIEVREDIVLPLQIIQQYALINMQNETADSDALKKLILKSMATNINAGRNSV